MRALKTPVPVETTGMTGFGPRSYSVVFDTTAPEQPRRSLPAELSQAAGGDTTA